MEYVFGIFSKEVKEIESKGFMYDVIVYDIIIVDIFVFNLCFSYYLGDIVISVCNNFRIRGMSDNIF